MFSALGEIAYCCTGALRSTAETQYISAGAMRKVHAAWMFDVIVPGLRQLAYSCVSFRVGAVQPVGFPGQTRRPSQSLPT